VGADVELVEVEDVCGGEVVTEWADVLVAVGFAEGAVVVVADRTDDFVLADGPLHAARMQAKPPTPSKMIRRLRFTSLALHTEQSFRSDGDKTGLT
jgi:hypothetical protein